MAYERNHRTNPKHSFNIKTNPSPRITTSLPPAKPVTSIPAIVIPVVLGSLVLFGIFMYILFYYRRQSKHRKLKDWLVAY